LSVALDGAGNLFSADNYNQRIRKVETNGIITTVAGDGVYNLSHDCLECGPGTFSGDGGPATGAGLNAPAATGLSPIWTYRRNRPSSTALRCP